MRNDDWLGKLPKSTKCILFAVLGFILLFLILGTWKAIFGLFVGVFGVFSSKHSKERDKVDDLKVKIDEEWRQKSGQVRKVIAAREAREKEQQEKDDKSIESETKATNEEQRRKKLMEDVDEILGEK